MNIVSMEMVDLSPPVFNVELAKRVLKQVTEFPESFDMGSWGYRDQMCGTTACLAGHAMIMSGYSMRMEPFEPDDPNACHLNCCKGVAAVFHRPDGSEVEAEENEGALLLGLDGDERAIFYNNEREAVAWLACLIEDYDVADQ